MALHTIIPSTVICPHSLVPHGHPSPREASSKFLRALAQIQRTRCPEHKHLGSYSVSGPKLGHNEDKMSQAVSPEHPIPWGWQIRKQTSQSSVMGGSPRLWGQQLAWGWGVFRTFGKRGFSAPGTRRSRRKPPGRQVGNKQGKHMPHLGNSCKVGASL